MSVPGFPTIRHWMLLLRPGHGGLLRCNVSSTALRSERPPVPGLSRSRADGKRVSAGLGRFSSESEHGCSSTSGATALRFRNAEKSEALAHLS